MTLRVCERLPFLSPAMFASMGAEDQAMLLEYERVRELEEARLLIGEKKAG